MAPKTKDGLDNPIHVLRQILNNKVNVIPWCGFIFNVRNLGFPCGFPAESFQTFGNLSWFDSGNTDSPGRKKLSACFPPILLMMEFLIS